ncbi:hypothetical protein NDU88_005685 [Pleurodeles waltl]|uniref:Uncharacterized protein n=1 Tax=Pleurodeles waltl TaxID=8319 RepID=A0AAV7NXB2_PLEWA|nr:hypothetical protein NDU88_005685 [Pleurodeles waltl]
MPGLVREAAAGRGPRSRSYPTADLTSIGKINSPHLLPQKGRLQARRPGGSPEESHTLPCPGPARQRDPLLRHQKDQNSQPPAAPTANPSSNGLVCSSSPPGRGPNPEPPHPRVRTPEGSP